MIYSLKKITVAKEEAIEEKETKASAKTKQEEDKSIVETITENPIARSMMRTAGNMLVRGLLGSLGLSGTTSRKKKKGFF